jgi:hypothetical protein
MRPYTMPGAQFQTCEILHFEFAFRLVLSLRKPFIERHTGTEMPDE